MEYFYGKNRQIHAHKTSSELIYRRPVQGVIAKVLGHIAYFYNMSRQKRFMKKCKP